MKTLQRSWPKGDQRGAVAMIVGVFLLFVALGVAAFAFDFSYRHIARNELQNAADAGALAGGRALYYEKEARVNVDGGDPYWGASANQIAYNTAVANKSAKQPVEVIFDGGSDNDHDVQRGHWCFGLVDPGHRGFYPNDSDVAVNIGGRSLEDLDEDLNFINAVRVVTRREASPVRTFLGKIFGRESFTLQAQAVAYRGFTASLPPGEIDMIIALCAQSLWVDDDPPNGQMDPSEFTDCEIGRMLNSGPDVNYHNTGAWTNLTQPCAQGTPSSARPLLEDCLETSPGITFGQGIGTTGGTDNSILYMPFTSGQPSVMACWVQGYYDDGDDETPLVPVDPDEDHVADYPWTITVPVIDCPSNNAGADGCPEVISAVTVNVVWILNQAHQNGCPEAPYRMYNPAGEGSMWEFVAQDVDGDGDIDGCDRWDAFVNEFQLENVDDQLATVANGGFMSKSLYFIPSCVPHEPTGDTGGPNFGMMADIPVLVK